MNTFGVTQKIDPGIRHLTAFLSAGDRIGSHTGEQGPIRGARLAGAFRTYHMAGMSDA